ncbi:MAG: DUF2264 domain-containing protein [Lachnospiraceae bacterium]|nr:DUF2264 domain-containing protein [Lachnospiraceae bacterium]
MKIERLETREDFVSLLKSIIDPLVGLMTPHKAGMIIGDTAAHYDGKAAMMEAFSRPLWGLVPLWAGGDKDERYKEIFREGLVNGTDPENSEYWGECHPFDQRFVEMAAISYGILYTRDVIWDPLSEKEKDDLSKYLYHINEYELPVCNWLMFAVLVNIALRSVGRRYSEELLNRYLDEFETFYVGEGWYSDGVSGQKDYYVSFAVHFYNLVYADRCGDIDPVRAEKFRERASEFARQFIYWFDETGGAVPYGRSLTYRFAQTAFFSACVMTKLTPFPLGVMKGIIVRHLKYWFEKDMFDRDGILTIGYGYPNLIMAERYNAPGSPYWALKTFAFLMLKEDHPFFREKSAELPDLKGPHPLYSAEMYIYHHGIRSTLFVPGKYSSEGHGQLPAKYSKFAYDSGFGISIAKSCYEIHENCPDSMLAFKIDGYIYVRRICKEGKILKDGVYSKWSPYKGISVVTNILPNEKGHIRIHEIESDIECEAYDCGFCVKKEEGITISEKKIGYARVSNSFSFCEVKGDNGCEGEVINADPNTNLLWNKTLIPAVRYSIPKGRSVLNTVITASTEEV